VSDNSYTQVASHQYSVSRKKETKMFTCNIFYKSSAILMIFGQFQEYICCKIVHTLSTSPE